MGILSTVGNMIGDVLDSTSPHAIYKLEVDGTVINNEAINRFMSMTITDNRGLESDTIEIQLSDHDSKLQIPPKGAVIQAWIGWSNEGLVYKGKYTVKEIEHAGAPDVLTLRASSADLKSSLKQKKERSFHNVTLQDVVQAIAHAHELE